VDEGRAIQAGVTEARDKEEDDLLNWAREWTDTRIMKYALDEAGDDYTVEEREGGTENVNTGLKRMLDEDESDEDGEDNVLKDVGVAVTSARRTSLGQVEFGMGEVKKDPDGKSRSIENILRYATSGTVNDQGAGDRK